MSTDAIDALENIGAAPWIVDAVRQLIRQDSGALGGVLHSVGEPVLIQNTRTTVRCHFVARDTQGRPRVKKLARLLAQRITEYCIPRHRISEAADTFAKTGSPAAFSALEQEARDLFADLTTSGEGGELLLYVLLESVLGIPQILAKMSLKTNAAVHYHGVDGVHAAITDTGNLALYWGESKLYQKPNQAIDSGFKSLAPFLTPDADASERDLMLVRDNLNITDEELAAVLLRYLDDEDPMSQNIEIRGACLIGFDLDEYPTSQDVGQVLADVTAHAEAWTKRVEKGIGTHKLEKVELEVFCVPFPSVSLFRKALAEQLHGTIADDDA